jgi:hypothetical protein
MVELVVAIALSILVLVGGVEMLRFMVLTTRASGDETLAALQVDYAGFWINQDALQAANITLANSTWTDLPESCQARCGCGNITIVGLGNLTLKWESADGNNTVTYEVIADSSKLDQDGCPLGRLVRTHERYSGGHLLESSQGNSTVAEYLVVRQIDDQGRAESRIGTTWAGNRTAGVLILHVASVVGQNLRVTQRAVPRAAGADITYEIHPRAGNVTWREVLQ